MLDPSKLGALGPVAFAADLDPHYLFTNAQNAPNEEVEEELLGFAADLAEIRALPEAEHGPKREFPKLWDKPKLSGLDGLLGLPAQDTGPVKLDEPDAKEETT